MRVPETAAAYLLAFIGANAIPGPSLPTGTGRRAAWRDTKPFRHGDAECVRDEAHVNRMLPCSMWFWALTRRGCDGISPHIEPWSLHCHVYESAGGQATGRPAPSGSVYRCTKHGRWVIRPQTEWVTSQVHPAERA